MGALLAATVDRDDTPWLQIYDGPLPEWLQTKWHQPRPDDHGLARCSSRIILNTEDITPLDASDAPARSDLCKRCFR